MLVKFFNFFHCIGLKFIKFKRVLEIAAWVFLGLTILISLTMEATRPFNYINIAFFIFHVIFSFTYILLFGKFVFDKFLIFSFIFLASQYLSTVINLFPSFTTTGTAISLMSISIYQFLKQFDYSKKIFLYIFSLASFFFIISFLIKYFPEIVKPNISNRIGDFFGNQNDVARNLSYATLSFLVCFINFKKALLKCLSIILALFSFYLILLTGSISNSLVILIVINLFIFLKLERKFKIFYFVLLFIFIGIIIALLQLPAFSYFKNRILKMINSFFGGVDGVVGGDASFVSRFQGAIYGFKLFFQNPLFGNGYSAVYRNYYIMAHNNIAEIAADFGLMGLISQEVLLIFPFLKNKSKTPEIYLLLMYTLLFQLFLVSFDAKIDTMIIAYCYLFITNDLRNDKADAIGYYVVSC